MTLFKIKMLFECLFLLLGVILMPIARPYSLECYGSSTISNDPLSLTVSIDKESFSLREIVTIQGTLKHDGSPVSDTLIGIEVLGPSELPVTYRTAPTSNISGIDWPVEFVDLYSCDSEGDPTYSFLTKQTLWIRGTVKNFDNVSHKITVTLNLYDGNSIPLGVWFPLSITLDAGRSSAFFFMTTTIPAWAYPGNATIHTNVFSGFPRNGGVPYCLERTASFEIKRNPELVYYSIPPSFSPTPDGMYLDAFRLPPESKQGTYTVHVSAREGVIVVENTTMFSV